ncbi:unnamed protein product [Eruca vesicaria subsp. sativa]|uniref:Uncharacterized protein n=1 Tax=Eruca vesicaria subsp. sativa TaxID=29727 RepID=A0ABC8M905_ERUVS|nr:unnamed protein product [Eruca vesicaria subsp. sativa]
MMIQISYSKFNDKLLGAHEEEVEYPFFTQGPKELREARIDIARYSIKRAAEAERARRQRDDPDEDDVYDAENKCALKQAKDMVLDCTSFADDRPLTACSFSRDGNIPATCGVTILWEMPQVTNKINTVLKSHKEHATDVVFSPVDDCLATASADRTAKLWKTDGTLLQTFEGIWTVLHVLPSTRQGSTSGQRALTKHGDCGI